MVRVPSIAVSVHCSAKQFGIIVDTLEIELLEHGSTNWTFYEEVRQEVDERYQEQFLN